MTAIALPGWVKSSRPPADVAFALGVAALLAVPYVVNTLRFRRITDATSGAAHRGWQLFLPLNYVTGFLVTLLLIGWALTRGAAA